MKKVLSLILSIVFVLLTFASCSEPADPSSSNNPSSSSPTSTNSPSANLAPIDVTIEKFEKGTITYSSSTEFTLKKDNAYQSMTEEYIYLPAGAVLSSDKEFAIFCFDSSFALNSAAMTSAGVTLDGINPTYKSGTFTMRSNSYVRISVKGAISDVKIEIPTGLKSSVILGDKTYLSILPKIKVINDFYSANGSNVNYIFLTDLHYGSGVDDIDGDGIRTYNTLEEIDRHFQKLVAHVESVVTIANNSPYIDFVVVGGDIVNGYETPDSPSYQESLKKDPNITVGKHLLTQIQKMLEPLKDCEKPVFVLSGNHDDNTGHSIYRKNDPSQPASVDAWHLSDLDWSRGVMKEFINVKVVRDDEYNYNGETISKYYYYDITKQGRKTRVICLDYNDDRFTFDENGEVLKRPNYGEYHDGQIKWLATKALQGDFDDCIVLSHASWVTSKGDALSRTLNAYQNKSTVKLISLEVDFSNRKGGDILVYHNGHEHKQYRKYDYSMRFWQISTPMMLTAIDLVSVGTEKTLVKAIDSHQIYELSKNGSENKTVQ